MSRMLAPGMLNDGTIQSYALGLRVGRYRGLPVVHHGGSWVGYRAATLRFPDQRFSVICLCNRADAEPWATAVEIADIYLSHVLQPERPVTISLASSLGDERVGTYWNDRTGGFAIVEVGERGLSLAVDEGNYHLDFVDENRFVGEAEADVESLKGSFEKSPDSTVRMHVQLEGQRPLEYVRVVPWEPTAADLASFHGTFYNEDLDVSYGVSSGSDGQLVLEGLELGDPQLSPVLQDGFRWEWGSLVFERSASGAISGFRMSAESERNLRFVRH